MKIKIILLVALVMPAYPALCGSVRPGKETPPRWFGATAAELAAPMEAAGRPDYAKAPSDRPLKVKARFVRALADGEAVQHRGKRSGRRSGFLVVAEGGEIRCEFVPHAKGVKAIRGMKRATPVVIRGTLDARRNVFLVDSIVQGWGRDQMGDGF